MSPNERAGLFIAPAFAPIVWTTILVFPELPDGMSDYWGTVGIVAFFGIPVAYLMALCLGLRLYILARNVGWATFWSISLGGAAVAALPTLITLLFMYDSWEAGRDWKLHGLFALTGFVVGAVFWCVVRYWPHNNALQSGSLASLGRR